MEFEKKLSRLEEIVAKMEAGDLSLDDSLKAFEEGVKLSRECSSQLTMAEQRVKMVLSVDATGKTTTEDFQIKE